MFDYYSYICAMNSDITIEIHPWQPYIPENAKVLILGTFPPKSSRWSMEFYYPNRINDFWRIIGLVFFHNKNHFYNEALKSFDLNGIKTFLVEKGIAVGDTALKVRRLKDNASDKFLEIVSPLPIVETISNMPSCTAIVSTSEKAAQIIASETDSTVPALGKCTDTIIDNRLISIYRMPSTSRAYPLSIDKKTEYYLSMFKSIGIFR